MYSKIQISSVLEVKTGMHIGGADTFSAIGAVDSPVIRDSLTGQPIIPGSSLKGKLRTLLARSIEQKLLLLEANKDCDMVKRLFGTSSKPITNSRLQFYDAFICNYEELKEIGTTEVKFENTINRITSEAKPRQIERVIRGTKFKIIITYDADDENQIEEDFTNIANALNLLQFDYLGGHGTRGYGRVSFSDISLKCVAGEIDKDKLLKLNNYLSGIVKVEQ